MRGIGPETARSLARPTKSANLEYLRSKKDSLRCRYRVYRLYEALDADVEDDDVLSSFLDHFHSKLVKAHSMYGSYFARGISFLNSRETGKSRLIRHVATKVPSFTIALKAPDVARWEGEPWGWRLPLEANAPVPDNEVSSYIEEHLSSYLEHIVAAAFLSALFHELYIWILRCYEFADGQEHLRVDLANNYEGFVEESQLKHDNEKDYYLSLRNESARQLEVAQRAFQDIKESKEPEKRLSLKRDILIRLYSLRDIPSQFGSETAHSMFLDGVVRLATAILKTDCAKYKHNGKERIHDLLQSCSYLDESQIGLIDSITRFFDLIDGLEDADTRQHHTQFIFGIDECDEEKYRSVITAGHRHRAGLKGFLRVFHDLRERDKVEPTSGRGVSVKGPKDPLQRVWLVVVDRGSEIKELSTRGRDPCVRLPEGFDALMSVYTTFGWDNAIRQLQKADPLYLDNTSISGIHTFQRLKLYGRILKGPRDALEELLSYVLERLLSDFEGWKYWDLFNKADRDYKRGDKSIGIQTFAIASYRFGLDGRFYYEHGNWRPRYYRGQEMDIGSQHIYFSMDFQKEEDYALQILQKSVSKHMRYMRDGKKFWIETLTPCEPLLALAALVTLNYGHSLFAAWTSNHTTSTRNCVAQRSDQAWARMLKEMANAYKVNPTLIDLGKSAQLAARIILSLARDCTLPETWPTNRHYSPHTTFEEFLKKLVGEEEAKMWFEKICPRSLGGQSKKAIMNFNQFIPIYTHIEEDIKEYDSDVPLTLNQVEQGFHRLVAFICLPNQRGYDLIIPMAIPKNGKSAYDGSLSMDHYDIHYIAVSVKYNKKAQDPRGELWSSNLVDRDRRLNAPSAAVFIQMDLGTDETFSNSSEDYISDHVAGDKQWVRNVLNCKPSTIEVRSDLVNFDGSDDDLVAITMMMMKMDQEDVKADDMDTEMKEEGEETTGSASKQKSSRKERRGGKSETKEIFPYALQLNLRIRGMQSAYPELRRLDPEGVFEASVCETMKARRYIDEGLEESYALAKSHGSLLYR